MSASGGGGGRDFIIERLDAIIGEMGKTEGDQQCNKTHSGDIVAVKWYRMLAIISLNQPEEIDLNGGAEPE